jgi:flagellar hook-basal body complex protein FliE
MQPTAVSGVSTSPILPSSVQGNTTTGAAPFGDLLKNAIGGVNGLEQQASAAVEGLLGGTGVDVHDVLIATQKADMSFELALAVRNKAVAAYQQVKQENRVRPMEYPMLAGVSTSGASLESPAGLALRVQELESTLAEREQQHARTMESVRREAMEQGNRQAGGDQVAWRQQCAAQLRLAVEQFRAQTDEYLAQVEQEVARIHP